MSDQANQLATLAQNIQDGVNNTLKDVHTAMPGIVIKFDAATQLASVQPAIKRLFKTDDGEKIILTPANLPVLINVPVIFPRGGGFSLTFPVAAGDECLVTFCERPFGSWHKFGGVQEPDARRFHALSDAVCFVGLSSLPNKVPNYSATDTVIKKDDDSVSISLTPDSKLNIYAESDINVTSYGNMNTNVKGNMVAVVEGDIEAETTNATILATDKIEFEAETSIDLTAPQIALNGNITGNTGTGGSAVFNGNMYINGEELQHNSTNVGDDHIHPQGNDSDGNAEQDTGGPQ